MKKYFVLLWMIISVHAMAQEHSAQAIKIFIDCTSCDFDYLKKEILWVDFVREIKDAEVYILISSQNTGGGGKEYTLTFQGQKLFKHMTDSVIADIPSNATEDETREKLTKQLKLGLIRYAQHSNAAGQLSIEFSGKENEHSKETDPWKSWVMAIYFNAWLTGEESYLNAMYNSCLSASKVTPEWKFETSLSHSYSESKYQLDNDVYRTYNRSINFDAFWVKSLGDHWSLGGRILGIQSTFSNLISNIAVLPGIEYNIFPYAKSTRKQFRLNYGIGASYRHYIDSTIFNKIEETLGVEKVNLAFGMIEKWGSMNASISWSNFLYDFNKYSLSVYTSLNFRIIKGLSFSLSGNLSFIHDQLGLSKTDATEEDILLRQKQLATQYSYWVSLGLNFSFGSIFNNVVNPRFGN